MQVCVKYTKLSEIVLLYPVFQ